MQYILALTTALAALAAAVPHPRNHLRLHHARDVSLESSVAGQPISTRDLPVDLIDGICGGSTGYGCQEGYCCSQWGYCGTDEGYCGVGCQFGACLATGGAAAVTTTTAAPVQTSIIGPASPVVPVSSSTEDDSTSTAVPNKAGGGWGPGGGAPTWSAPAWTAPSQPTTLVTSVWTAPSSSAIQQPTTTQPTTSSTPVQQPSTTTSTPAPASTGSSGGAGLGDKYIMYQGDGTTSAGWPSEDSWLTFETMWNNNLAIIKPSCANNVGTVPNNSDEENADIKSAILATAASTGVDARFILAIVLQESKGCVRIYTTANGVRNPGLMQDHNGMGSCNAGIDAQHPADVQTPCPASQITLMIQDGVMGTLTTSFPGGVGGPGDGLVQILSKQTMSDATKYYRAARLYNSGRITDTNLNDPNGATACYVTDIVNRLTGWVLTPTQCH